MRQEWKYDGTPDYKKNYEEAMIAALKPFMRECETCHGRGEYETEYGPMGCNLCSSRLIPLTLDNGKPWDLDWGDIAIIEDGKLVDVLRPRKEA